MGEGNVGKTCLVAALRGDPFVAGRSTTHGIEIHTDLRPSLRARHRHHRARVDFGGQEVYRITHQFFFTPRALYLVFWKAREGQEQNEVEGWLRRIRLRIRANAKVLVVATHCEERRPELPYSQLQQLVPGPVDRTVRGRLAL